MYHSRSESPETKVVEFYVFGILCDEACAVLVAAPCGLDVLDGAPDSNLIRGECGNRRNLDNMIFSVPHLEGT